MKDPIKAPIAYYGGDTPVEFGDWVETRFWLLFYRFKKRGRIVYILGISPINREFEHDGLTWVGIQPDDDRAVIGEPVDPRTYQLLKRVRFLRRDDSPLPEGNMPDDSGLSDGDEEGTA